MATLGSLAIGTTVQLKENGKLVDFLVVQQGKPSSIYDSSFDNTTMLMRKNYYGNSGIVWDGTSSSYNNDYEQSDIDKWLNGTYFNLLDPSVRNIIKQVKWPFWKGLGNVSSGNPRTGANGLSRKIVLPSAAELGMTKAACQANTNYSGWVNYMPDDGAKLAYFNTGVAADTKRKATFDNGNSASGWTRSPYVTYTNYALIVNTDGSLSNDNTYDSRGVRPVLCVPSSAAISSDGTMSTAPNTVPSITVPTTVYGGAPCDVSWGATTDPNGDLAGYELEKKEGSGNWTQVYRGSATRATVNVAHGVSTVAFRVRAYDAAGHYSAYTTSPTRTITNVNRPTMPNSLTVPEVIRGGEPTTITWGPATDADNNLQGYKLERSSNGATYEELYKGPNLNYNDTVPKGTGTVRYRVAAFDTYEAYSDWNTGPLRTVTNNTAPVVQTTQSGSLGEVDGGISFSYSVLDEDGQTIDITEYLDDEVLNEYFNVESGTSFIFSLTDDDWKAVTNGRHTIRISVTDGEATSSFQTTFERNSQACSIMLKDGLEMDGPITAASLSYVGSIPPDAVVTAKLTNNFARNADGSVSDSVVWEDASVSIKTGLNHVFQNQNADDENGVLNFLIKAEAGPSGAGGNFTSIQGGCE